MDLIECVGFPADSINGLEAPNYTALFAALRYNTHFRTLQIKKNSRREVLVLLFNTLKTNNCLSRLIVESDNSNSTFVGIGEALRQNKESAVQILQFANNPITMGEKGVINLSKGLEELPRALTHLDLSNCGVNDKGLSNLIYSFEKNYGMSLALQHLNLSQNKFEDEGSSALSNWLTAMNGNSMLEVLKLSSCGNINLMMVSRGVSLITRLREWDISGNKIIDGTVHLVCSVLESSNTLKQLNVSGCQLANETAYSLMAAFFANKKLHGISLDLSKNHFNNWTPANKKPMELLPRSFSERVADLWELNLSDLHLKDVHLVAIVQSLYNHPSLQRIVLSNSLDSTVGPTDRIASALSALVWSTPSLRSLILAGGFPGKTLPVFLQGISHNGTLKELDLSNNQLRDVGALSVAEFLRENKSIEELRLENNTIGLAGWHAIGSAMRTNRSLVRFHKSFPWNDYDRILMSVALAAQASSSSLNVGAVVAAVTSTTANGYLPPFTSGCSVSNPTIERLQRVINQIQAALHYNVLCRTVLTKPQTGWFSSTVTPMATTPVSSPPSSFNPTPISPHVPNTNGSHLVAPPSPNGSSSGSGSGSALSVSCSSVSTTPQKSALTSSGSAISNSPILNRAPTAPPADSQSVHPPVTLLVGKIHAPPAPPSSPLQPLLHGHGQEKTPTVSPQKESGEPSGTNTLSIPSNTPANSTIQQAQGQAMNTNTIAKPATSITVPEKKPAPEKHVSHAQAPFHDHDYRHVVSHGQDRAGASIGGSGPHSIPAPPPSHEHLSMAAAAASGSTISILSTSPSRGGVIPPVAVPVHLLQKSLSLTRAPDDDDFDVDDDDIVEHSYHPAFPHIGPDGKFCSCASDDDSGNSSDNSETSAHKKPKNSNLTTPTTPSSATAR
eukprot:TRINITY_DN126_c0_g2_i1.p1 TRINITY_DN126_c0_g2~~TRINITY_DN126_c0_g2_i1.p1  ORF type:complete len:899 (+),score=195.85 TRINITY_DN126_c0_g2_i1:722-3418(+)